MVGGGVKMGPSSNMPEFRPPPILLGLIFSATTLGANLFPRDVALTVAIVLRESELALAMLRISRGRELSLWDIAKSVAINMAPSSELPSNDVLVITSPGGVSE